MSEPMKRATSFSTVLGMGALLIGTLATTSVGAQEPERTAGGTPAGQTATPPQRVSSTASGRAKNASRAILQPE
jgi:hypothetical protein